MILLSGKLTNSLANPQLSSEEKIEKIKEAFDQDCYVRLNQQTGRYYQGDSLAVNLGGRLDWTILGYCVERTQDLGVIRWLVEKQGADVDLANTSTANPIFTPLCIAISLGKLKIMHYLLSRGANPNPLTSSIKDQPLFRRRATREVTGPERRDFVTTPLHHAILLGQVEAVKLLLLYKADIHKENHVHQTPLQYAHKLLEIVEHSKHPEYDVYFKDYPAPSTENLRLIISAIRFKQYIEPLNLIQFEYNPRLPLPRDAVELISQSLCPTNANINQLFDTIHQMSESQEVKKLYSLEMMLDRELPPEVKAVILTYLDPEEVSTQSTELKK